MNDLIPVIFSFVDPRERWTLSQVCRSWKKELLRTSVDGLMACKTGDFLAVVEDQPSATIGLRKAVKHHQHQIFRYLYHRDGDTSGVVRAIAIASGNEYVLRYLKVVIHPWNIYDLLRTKDPYKLTTFFSHKFDIDQQINQNSYYMACTRKCIPVITRCAKHINHVSTIELYNVGLHDLARTLGKEFHANDAVRIKSMLVGIEPVSAIVELDSELMCMIIEHGDVDKLEEFERVFVTNIAQVVDKNVIIQLCSPEKYEMLRYLIKTRRINIPIIWTHLINSYITARKDTRMLSLVYEFCQFPPIICSSTTNEALIWMFKNMMSRNEFAKFASQIFSSGKMKAIRYILANMTDEHKRIARALDLSQDDAWLLWRWKKNNPVE